jgi:alpha-beta hydrolase superfamily lysophospholipase
MHSSPIRCASHNFGPRPLHHSSRLRLGCPIRPIFAAYADLPIYLFSGSEHPVGQQLERVEIPMERYRKAGIRDISYHFYIGGRYEMLNEVNRDAVLANLLAWVSAVLEREGSIETAALTNRRIVQ